MCKQIVSYLTDESDALSRTVYTFGYRERMKIERGLFLLLKILCKNMLGHNLQGFSESHRMKVFELIARKKRDDSFIRLINRIWQLKVYIQSLSSENAYVRGDALSRLGLDKKSVFSFINYEIQKIGENTILLTGEQGAQLDR
jgi:hypothetical protein